MSAHMHRNTLTDGLLFNTKIYYQYYHYLPLVLGATNNAIDKRSIAICTGGGDPEAPDQDVINDPSMVKIATSEEVVCECDTEALITPHAFYHTPQVKLFVN